jgi:ketosteroid isomerase-like protein
MTTTTIEPTQLPATIRAYLAAHAAKEADAAARTFSPDAVVIDEGRTFRGTAQVREFLRKAGGQ